MDLAGFFQARAERNAYLACACLIFYEYLIQLDNEVEFFWKQRWSVAKALFLWSRYYSLGYNISNAVVFMQPKPTEHLCLTFFHWQNTGASLQVITTHVILELRLYAMYGSTRGILYLFICMTLGEALAMGLVFGLPNPKLIGTNEPFPGNFICADADPMDHTHWVIYYWAAIIIIEGTLLSLALWKAWQHRASAHGSSLMQQLTKGSVLYFFFIFWIYCANLVLWYYNRITLDEFGTAFAFVMSSIFANRLLIAVRANYYSSLNDVDTYLPSVRFIQSSRRSTTFAMNTIESLELRTFNERTGV
jgi:hypothetical protein